MSIPVQPTDLVPRPFASDGTYKVVPETKEASGRASYTQGFPSENQLPLGHGGIAPNRMDLNGILNLLTSFAHWQQSGGQWAWKNTLNYAVPSLVFHKNIIWCCKASSGPETTAKAVEPGTDSRYWEELLIHLFDTGTLKMKSDTPVGTVITYFGTSAPEGYLACDGRSFSASVYPELYAVLGKAVTPDLRGQFIRGYDPGATVDPDGRNRTIGHLQGDAIRNITGYFDHGPRNDRSDPHASGAFTTSSVGLRTMDYKSGDTWWQRPSFTFNASRVVPTAAENRPKNACLLYCIKHD